MSTALAAITVRSPVDRELVIAGTVYSIDLPPGTQQVSVFTEAAGCRMSNAAGAQGTDDGWMPLLASGISRIATPAAAWPAPTSTDAAGVRTAGARIFVSSTTAGAHLKIWCEVSNGV